MLNLVKNDAFQLKRFLFGLQLEQNERFPETPREVATVVSQEIIYAKGNGA